MGSNVTKYEIDWLYRSRRIPEGVTCRIPGDEIIPDPEPDERVVFLAHFERGFGLPPSSFFLDLLDFYKLQPHHLPNSVFYLSCFTTFMEAYIGIRTFFYVKNNGPADLICLPPFDPAPPAKTNWSYNPKESHNETNRIIRFMKQKMKDTGICSDDIIRTFISRRVLPLKRRAHRMSEMYGPGDPTKITGLPLSKKDAKDRFPLIEAERRGACRKRADSFDPDPSFLEGSEDGQDPGISPGPVSAKANRVRRRLEMLEIHEHVPPLRAEAGTEFVDKLMAQGQKNKRSPSDDGSSQAPPSKRFRTEELGEKKVGAATRAHANRSRPALKLGSRPSGSEGSARTSTPPHSSPAPPGAGNISASSRGAQQVRGVRPLHLLITARRRILPSSSRTKTPHQQHRCRRRRSRRRASSSSALRKDNSRAESSAPGSSNSGGTSTAPFSANNPYAAASAPSAKPPAAYRATARASRLIKGSRASHALRPSGTPRYHSGDPRPGKDRQPAPDPIGNRSSEEHFTRLRCAVKELDSSWYDATNNLMTLFEELLWEHRELVEAHDKCQVLPEASIDALKEQLNAQRLFPDSQTYAVKKVNARRPSQSQASLAVPWTPNDHLVALNARVSHMRAIDRNLSDIPDVASQLYRTLWPGEVVPDTFSLISDRLKGAGRRIREWQCSAARAGADSVLRVACSWYPELDLDALTGVREGAETDLDPILAAKRQDRAYRIAEYAEMRTFIPPPHGVQDYLDEEEDEAEEEPLDDAGAGDAPPEAPAA
ncbi:hypothetical protein QYE76_057563 [Lolium multiflorum]|uniref:Transposase (putative) gypsy type domain-containing protein n=1 Tax=Lolium multiflorum TaxID=4521 RepID=A0AAD8T4W5_LOLMU|nr:hypothetical protein QYE76_057563 [Lolium multiflorum]